MEASGARKFRLTKPAEFQRVFQNACKSGDAALLVLARRNDRGYPRLGLAISIKAARGAVTRNRVKRIVRESFRRHQAALGSLDFVVTGRPLLAEKTNPELRAALDKHWQTLASCKKS
ncbi:MAG: ribonuclease P protein component [Pseudomonadota bacterium]